MHGEYDRILGALVGCAVGDAMGMPAEMWSQRRIRETFGEITDFLPGPPDNEISAGFAAGETTDDSIVTVLVARALIHANGIPDPLDLVHSIENWAANNPKSRTIIGPSTRRAFDLIAQGVSPAEAGRGGETNGASMRISPLGAVCSIEDLPLLVRRAAQLCLPTHNTATAIAGASAVAAAVAHGVGGGVINDVSPVVLQAAHLGAKQGYEGCGPSVEKRLELSLQLSSQYPDDREFMEHQYALVGCGLPTSESVPTALAIALRCGGDVLRCARICANIGGDTDTMGAIACAISGAYAGIAAIPRSLADRVAEKNGFDYPSLAQGLLTLRRQMAKC